MFYRCSYDNCVYILKREEKFMMFLLLNVDNILIATKYEDEFEELKGKLSL